jgi:hypothetical protein
MLAVERTGISRKTPQGYHVGMTDMATIKVSCVVRDRVRDAARAAHLTQGQLLEEMLEQRRRAEFWAALESETPDQEYLDELAEADTAFASDAEESIARFETGQ